MDYYKLHRDFWDFCFENPEKIKPNHCALYCFVVEHCNRLGWKPKFGLPTTMAKDAIGIRSYTTYIQTLNDLVDFGFIILHEKSKNQYSSNIVGLLNFDKALDKALDKAFINHASKQVESTQKSTDSIIIPINNNTKDNNTNIAFCNELLNSQSWLESLAMNNQKKFNLTQVKEKLNTFTTELNLKFDFKQNKTEFSSHFVSWLNKQENTKVKPYLDSPY